VADERPLVFDRLPTLTEVLEVGQGPTVGTLPDGPPAPTEVPAFDLSFPPAAPVETGASTEPTASIEPAAAACALPPLEPCAAVTALAAQGEPPARLDAQALVNLVLAQLESRLGEVLEDRLGAALAPALARAADSLIRDARQVSRQTLRALVEEAVAQVLRDARQAGVAHPD
jgi:hypothetical protein